MNISFVPSLQCMAVTKIVTRLWNLADIILLIAECDENYREECWRAIERKVNEKISLLPSVPAPLREKLSSVVIPLGDQIREWKWIHFQRFGFKNIPRQFCWTSLGTVDKKRMAEAFFHDPTRPEVERYNTACLYCIKWDNPVPFQSSELKSFLLSKFQACWTYNATGDVTALDDTWVRDTSQTPYQRAFRFAYEWGNVVAAEYYFRKLSPEEREELLSNIQLDLYLPDFDMYRFLLLHMDERQQSTLLREETEVVLLSLLEWPWQPLFMDAVRYTRDVIDRHQYSYLLKRIVYKIGEGYKDYSYRELFSRIWVQIPVDHKKDLVCDLLSELLIVGDEKILPLVLKEVSPEEKEQILLSDGGILLCESLAQQHRWDLLELFIGECLLTRDKMIQFKEKCKKRTKYFGSTFFQFLNKLVEKRGPEEEMDCPVPHKRLCGSPGVSTDHA